MGSRNYIYPASSMMTKNSNQNNPTVSDNSLFEFDESEIWNQEEATATTTATKKWIPQNKKMGMMRMKMISTTTTTTTKTTPTASSSLPVNIPDWSKILKEDYNDHRKISHVDDDGVDFDGGDDDDLHHGGNRDWIPPHEYLASTRGASLSVHEGIGRTLKGRDLRRVRNAIWKKVGFED